MIAFVKEYLNAPSYWFGIINAAFFVGLLVGSKMIHLIERFKMVHFYYSGYMLLSLITFVFGINRWLILAVLLSWLYGIIEQLLSISLHTEIQKHLNHETLLDTYTLNQSIYSLGFCLSTFVMSLLAEHATLTFAFVIASLAYLLICLLTYRYKNIF